MNEDGIKFGIALIVASVTSYFIPLTAYPKKMQDAQIRGAEIWGVSTKQLQIIQCAVGALTGALMAFVSMSGRR